MSGIFIFVRRMDSKTARASEQVQDAWRAGRILTRDASRQNRIHPGLRASMASRRIHPCYLFFKTPRAIMFAVCATTNTTFCTTPKERYDHIRDRSGDGSDGSSRAGASNRSALGREEFQGFHHPFACGGDQEQYHRCNARDLQAVAWLVEVALHVEVEA